MLFVYSKAHIRVKVYFRSGAQALFQSGCRDAPSDAFLGGAIESAVRFGRFSVEADDTLIRTIETRYGVDLHARGDARLGNLLESRGFDSVTQLEKAYRGELTYDASKRRIYLSLHVDAAHGGGTAPSYSGGSRPRAESAPHLILQASRH
jgi:hypothetical protein